MCFLLDYISILRWYDKSIKLFLRPSFCIKGWFSLYSFTLLFTSLQCLCSSLTPPVYGQISPVVGRSVGPWRHAITLGSQGSRGLKNSLRSLDLKIHFRRLKYYNRVLSKFVTWSVYFVTLPGLGRTPGTKPWRRHVVHLFSPRRRYYIPGVDRVVYRVAVLVWSSCNPRLKLKLRYNQWTLPKEKQRQRQQRETEKTITVTTAILFQADWIVTVGDGTSEWSYTSIKFYLWNLLYLTYLLCILVIRLPNRKWSSLARREIKHSRSQVVALYINLYVWLPFNFIWLWLHICMYA